MLRYCTICNKDFEFEPQKITSKDPLLCPECGNIIEKTSRHPSNINSNGAGDAIGNAMSGIFRLIYLFYLTLSLVGLICYFFNAFKAMYVIAAIMLIAYIIQFFTGTTAFVFGIIIIPVSCVLGYFVLHGINGICVAVFIVFLARYIIRDIIWSIIAKLIQAGSK